MAPVPPAVRADLAPSGTMRVGINHGNLVLAQKNPTTGEVKGVAVDLAHELGRRLGAADELHLERLPEVGRYYYDGEEVTLPVPPEHRWYPAWQRFSDLHAPLANDVTALIVADPLDRRSLPALRRHRSPGPQCSPVSSSSADPESTNTHSSPRWRCRG